MLRAHNQPFERVRKIAVEYAVFALIADTLQCALIAGANASRKARRSARSNLRTSDRSSHRRMMSGLMPQCLPASMKSSGRRQDRLVATTYGQKNLGRLQPIGFP